MSQAKKSTTQKTAGARRMANVGGVAVKVASPKTDISAAKAAKIRSAVREFYAEKKGK